MIEATNTHLEVEASGVDTAVLPVGAIEQHGPHLPLATDWAQAEAVARGVAGRLDAFLLPGIPYGCSQAHAGFRGTVSLSQETLGAVVKDIARSLLGQGFPRVVVLNFHGGNLILKLAVRELNMSQRQGMVVLTHPFLDIGDNGSRILEKPGDDLHAGELETSLMMHLAPDQVGDERPDYVPDVGPEYFDYVPMKEFCPDGVWGHASLATAEKGEQLLASMVARTSEVVEAAFARLRVGLS